MFKKLVSLFYNNDKKKKKKKNLRITSYNKPKVWFDESKLYYQSTDSDNNKKNPKQEKVNYILWDSIIRIAIETTDKGPQLDDIILHIASNNKIISFPSETTGTDQLLERFQQIKGFNNKTFIEAMTSTENKIFILWYNRNNNNQKKVY